MIGVAIGCFNAFVIDRFKMIPLIVTLGTASIVRGLMLGLLGTSIVNINKMPEGLMAFGSMNIATATAANGAIVGLTGMILVYGGIAFIMHFVLKHSMIGRSIYAYGGDPEAARRAGVNTRGTIFFVYCTAGLLAGFAGLLHSSMIWQANPRDFMGLELDVLAAVLGGASIFGGRGSVIGTMIGVFTLVMVKNSLILMKIDTTCSASSWARSSFSPLQSPPGATARNWFRGANGGRGGEAEFGSASARRRCLYLQLAIITLVIFALMAALSPDKFLRHTTSSPSPT